MTPLPFLAGACPAPDPGAAAGMALASRPPAVTPAMAEELARRHYGVTGVARMLTSERDANFRLTLDDGRHVLLKIANDQEDAATVGMQTAALIHLAAVAPGLPVQRVHPTRDGEAHAGIAGQDGRRHILRMVSFIDGTMLHAATPGPGLYRDLGATLGRLALGLRGFFHPAAGHVLPWDLKQAHRLWPLVGSIGDGGLRRRVETLLRRFDDRIAPRLPHLRSQVVHNDFNPHNLIVDGARASRIAGVIDFGDMVHTALACDLAVACSYHLGAGPRPFDAIAAVVAGYHAVLPLEDEEIALLSDLIALRNVATLAITAWRAARFPENSAYILRNAPASLRGLDALDAAGPEAVARILRHALTAGPEGDPT